MINIICDKCGAYTHEYDKEERHGFIDTQPCPNMSEEEIRKNLINYFKAFQDHNDLYRKIRSSAQLKINRYMKNEQFWKGKYMIVKEENNSIRKNSKKS